MEAINIIQLPWEQIKPLNNGTIITNGKFTGKILKKKFGRLGLDRGWTFLVDDGTGITKTIYRHI